MQQTFQWRRRWPIAILTLGVWLAGCGSPEQREAGYLARGNRYLDQHDYAAALAAFRDAAQAMPRDPEPYYRQALAHLPAGDFRLAVGALLQAVELNPKYGPAQLKLAELMTTSSVSRDIREAKGKLEDFLNSNPDDLEAVSALAAADWKLGFTADSERRLKDAVERFPRNVRAWALLAKVYLMNQDLNGVGETLQKASRAAPDSAPVLMALAEFYSLLGKTAEARDYYQRVLRITPDDPTALLDLAALENGMGQTAAAEEHYKRAAKTAGGRYATVHAMFLLNSGRAREAITELQELRRRDPEDRGVRSLLVNAYTAAGRNPEAEGIVSEALVQNPKDVAAFFQRSIVRLREGRISDAQTDLSQVLSLQSNLPEAHFLQALIHQRSGALKAEQLELTETLRLKPDLLPARLELARVLVHNGDPQGALDVLNRAFAAQKKTSRFLAQRNWALFLNGDARAIRKGIDEGLALFRTPELLVQDALFQLEQGRLAPAQQSIDEALRANPSEIRALNLWVRILSRRGDPEPALRAFAGQHPNLPEVQQFYGEMLLSAEKRAEARAAFLRAKSARPDFRQADFSLAEMAIQDRRPEEALRILPSLLNTPGGMRAHMMMAAAEQMRGNVTEAIRHFETVAIAEPRNVSALNDLAYLLADTGRDTEAALKYAQKAQELAPHDPDVEDTLGWVLYHRGMYSMALDYLRDSLNRRNTALTNLHLAMAYARNGDIRQGRTFLQAAMRQSPALPGLDAARQLIGSVN